MRNVKQEETPDGPRLREVRQTDGHQVGKERPVSRLYELSRVQEYDEFYAGREGGKSSRKRNRPRISPAPSAASRCPPRQGRFGKFLGCTGYPECKHTINVVRMGRRSPPRQGERERHRLREMRETDGRQAGLFRDLFSAVPATRECKNIVRTPRAQAGAPAGPRLNSPTSPATSAGSRWP